MKRILAVLAVFLLLPLFSAAATVTIYHTSDTHGFYFPRNKDGKRIGGFASLANVLAAEQRPYLLLDSGDFTSGTYEAKQTKGALSVEFFNLLDYDASVIGNHEGDFKEEPLAKNIAAAKFDVLSANFYDKKTGKLPQGVKPFKTYMVNGKKIGVIGIAKDPRPGSAIYKTTFGRKELKKAVYELKKQNPDAIVVLVHNGFEDDKHEKTKGNADLVKNIDGINLVLGGHVHKIKQNVEKDGVIFVESGSEMQGFSKIYLDFNDETGALESIKSQYIELLTDKFGEDPKVKEFADDHRAKEMDEIIAKANEKILKSSPDTSKGVDSPLGNLLADIIKNQTKAEVALHNTGGVRVDIEKGDITKRNVNEVFPFPNKMMIVNMDGKALKKIILHALKEDRSLFQYSGLEVKYQYKHKRPKIISVTVNGKPLDEKRIYSVAVNDYIAEGNSEGYLFKKLNDKKIVSDKYISDIFIEFLNENKETGINTVGVGRIQKVANEK